jgi:hypothetical protein
VRQVIRALETIWGHIRMSDGQSWKATFGQSWKATFGQSWKATFG